MRLLYGSHRSDGSDNFASIPIISAGATNLAFYCTKGSPMFFSRCLSLKLLLLSQKCQIRFPTIRLYELSLSSLTTHLQIPTFIVVADTYFPYDSSICQHHASSTTLWILISVQQIIWKILAANFPSSQF